MLIKFFPNGRGRGSGPVGYLIADQLLAYDANRDLIVVRDVVMLLAGVVVVVNFIVDVLYAVVDPRLRRGDA